MLFNNGRFGQKIDALTDSLFVEDYMTGSLVPPPHNYFLLDNDGEILLDNSGDPFLVD